MTRRDLGTAVPSIAPGSIEDIDRDDLDVAIAVLTRIRDRLIASGGRQSARPAHLEAVERSSTPRLLPMEAYSPNDRLKPGEAAKIANCSTDSIKRWVRLESIGWISATGRYTVCRPLLLDLLQARKSGHARA